MVGEIAALVSAIVSATSLLLDQLRRRERPPATDGLVQLRNALIRLEGRLNAWARQAWLTNATAKAYVATLAEGGDSAAATAAASRELMMQTMSQMASAVTPEDLNQPTPPVGQGEDTVAMETLLRICAPELSDLTARLDNRIKQLSHLNAELDQRYQSGGEDAVRPVLADLDCTSVGLSDAGRQIADFIRSTFPLLTSEQE